MRPPERPEQEFSIEEAQRRSARRLAAGAILALILLALVRPGYHWIKEARSRTLARRAETALSQGDITNAAHWAQSAYLMRPSEPAALRAAARVQGTLGHPNALEFWQGLIATGRASSDDRREYVQFAVRVHALDRARAELQALVHEAPSDPRNLWLLGRICFAEGRLDEAVEFVRQALRQDAGNKTYRLFLATLEYDSPDRSSQAEARQTLAELAADPTSLGLEALTFLARQPDLPPDQRRPLVEGLERNPASGTAHRLLALDLKIRSAADQRAGLIEAALRQYAGSGDENVALFGSWLNDHREFGVTLRLLPPEAAAKNREQFLLLLDALGGLDRWQEAQDLLARPDLPIPEAFAEAFRARTARKLNDPAGSTAAWKRAFQGASGNLEQLAFLAQYAEKGGEYDEAVRFYRALAGVQADSRSIYLRWLRLLEAQGTTEELRDLLKVMAERWPDEISFRNDLAYLDLLLNRNVESATKVAEDLVEAHPGNLPFRAALALGRLRSKNPSTALEAFAGRDWDWTKALPGHRAIHAAALAAAGRAKEAAARAGEIPPDSLRREERQLLDSALAGK